MKTGNKTPIILKAVSNFFVLFLPVAFVVTCCITLFTTTLSSDLQITLTSENLNTAAKLTFLNALLITLLFTIIDTVRRRFTVKRPIQHITQAAEKIIHGDFSVRIKPQGKIGTDESFNEVINCFNQLAEELGSVETLRSDFIANVSHEMKTPLAVIQNYGTLLQSENLSDEERIEYAKGINAAACRMAEMITNILKLNKIENQQIYPKTSEFDLGEQLCECLLRFESVWEKSDIQINTDIADGIKVKADKELLSLVWNNLFSNAFKFTDKGGTVSVALSSTEHHAVVTVKDTGCGMSQEVGSHIFEKFYQGDTSHATHGNGLGLALVKRVVDILHGEIDVESTVGIGTTFTVKIGRT